ncbi:hypothetical protein [Gilliamella apicola]|uniref:hypothetical protein n=1 Tax=Gilliamella apicola TaxID=1196095 RepID=UPI002FEE596A
MNAIYLKPVYLKSLWQEKLYQRVFFNNNDTDESELVIPEPETITNVGELVLSCEFVSVRDGNDEVREYYLCTTPDGEQYTIESEED